MALPPLTPEQRAAALAKAALARQTRAEIKRQLKSREVSLTDVIAKGQHDAPIGRLRVVALIEAMPGTGPVKARAIMEEIGISPSRRVKGLGPHQTAALLARFQ